MTDFLKLNGLSFLLLINLIFNLTPVFAEKLTFEGKVAAQITRSVVAPFSLDLEKMLVQIGDNVEKDQRLMEYSLSPQYSKGLMRELMTGGGLLDIEMQISTSEQEMLQTNARRKQSADLANAGLGPQAEVARINSERNQQQKRLNGLRQKEKIQKMDFSLRLEELEQLVGHKLKRGQTLPKELFLCAPTSGTVIQISPAARPGAFLPQGTHIFTLAQLNPIQVQVEVHESEVNTLQVGSDVEVELAGQDNVKFTGKVTQISWQTNDARTATPSYYNVQIDVDNPDYVLRPGFKVLISIGEGKTRKAK